LDKIPVCAGMTIIKNNHSQLDKIPACAGMTVIKRNDDTF